MDAICLNYHDESPGAGIHGGNAPCLKDDDVFEGAGLKDLFFEVLRPIRRRTVGNH